MGVKGPRNLGRKEASRRQEQRAESQGKARGLESRSLLEGACGARPCDLGKTSEAGEGASLGGQTFAREREALRQEEG